MIYLILHYEVIVFRRKFKFVITSAKPLRRVILHSEEQHTGKSWPGIHRGEAMYISLTDFQ